MKLLNPTNQGNVKMSKQTLHTTSIYIAKSNEVNQIETKLKFQTNITMNKINKSN